MTKITYQAGSEKSPLFKVTIEVQYDRHDTSMYDLQEILAKYFVHHGGLHWSVNHE